MLNAATPLFTFVLAQALLSHEGESDSRAKLAGVGAGLVGVALILQPWNQAGQPKGALLGSLTVLAASIFYGYGFVFARKYLGNRGGSPKVMALGQITFACLFALPLLLVPTSTPGGANHGALGPLVAIIVLGVIQTGIATLMFHRVVRALGATASSAVSYIIPLSAVVAGVVFADDHLSVSFIGGAVVVFFSVFLLARNQPRRSPVLQADLES